MMYKKGKYIAEYVYFARENKEGLIIQSNGLTQNQRDTLLEHGKMAINVNLKPNYKKILPCVRSVSKFGGHFTGDEYMEVVNNAKSMWPTWGFHVPILSDAQDTIHFARKDIIKDILVEMDIYEEGMALPKEKFLNRLHKILGEQDKVEFPPRVGFVEDLVGLKGGMEILAFLDQIEKADGYAFCRPSWMLKNNLPLGFKTTNVTKYLGVPGQIMDDMDMSFDIIVPKKENKWNLSREKLSRNFRVIRRLSPEFQYSRNLKDKDTDKPGRKLKYAWDYRSLTDIVPTPDISDLKALVEEGKITDELLDKLFGFMHTNGPDKGTRGLRPVGKAIKAGMDPRHPEINKDVLDVVWAAIKKRMVGKKSGSISAVALPLHLLNYINPGVKTKRAWITRNPDMMPVLTEYALAEHCAWVNADFWAKVKNGDFDGELASLFHKNSMDTELVYPRDKEFLERISKAPAKEEADNTNKTYVEVICDIIDQLSLCGRVYNAGKAVVDTARMDGWDYLRLVELDATIVYTFVQPFINGQKYVGGKKLYTAEELCDIFKVSTKNLSRIIAPECGGFYNAIRSQGSTLANAIFHARFAKANSKSFYERVLAVNLKNWKLPVFKSVKQSEAEEHDVEFEAKIADAVEFVC